MRFLRWGSFRPQRHDNGNLPSDSRERTFHTAPRVWGFYAFSQGFSSLWLLGWGNYKDHKKNGRFHWIRDEHGKKVRYEEDVDFHLSGSFDYYNAKKYSRREKHLRRINNIRCNFMRVKCTYDEGQPSWYYYEKPNYFNYSGDIWHHLEFFEYDKCSGNYSNDDDWITKKIRLVPEDEIIDRCGSWIKTSMRTYSRALYKYNNYFKFYMRDYWSSPKILERNSRNIITHDEEEILEVYIEKL